jgi:hypothetical protein
MRARIRRHRQALAQLVQRPGVSRAEQNLRWMTDGDLMSAQPAGPDNWSDQQTVLVAAVSETPRSMTIPAVVTAARLLDAMEGVAYLTDRNAIILAIGQHGWTRFADDNAVPWLNADAVIGTSLLAAMTGNAVRDAYRRLHDAVSSGRRAMTVFEYRCDAPIAERHMRMSITAVHGESGVAAVLYQSQLLAEATRPPLRLFSRELRVSEQRAAAAIPCVRLCSFCQRVGWPLEADGTRPRWIDATDYYRRGGPADVTVVDTVCPSCTRHVVLPHV